MQQKSKLRGWLLILAVAALIAIIFVFGTMDASQRYQLIGL